MSVVRVVYCVHVVVWCEAELRYRVCSECFCFQAEDGIRDLVRSRGLGDVYKRQVEPSEAARSSLLAQFGITAQALPGPELRAADLVAVSYTHLTLPTSDLV